jgi:hypothetical protein
VSAGAQVGTVSAMMYPFFTLSADWSGNWTFWPKYGSSDSTGLWVITRP